MYNGKRQPTPTVLKTNTSYVGETIEQKVERLMVSKEPIADSSPEIYTERKDGVLPAYDIRTDRWDIAIDAMDIADKSNKAKREERHKVKEEEKPKEGVNTSDSPKEGTSAPKN